MLFRLTLRAVFSSDFMRLSFMGSNTRLQSLLEDERTCARHDVCRDSAESASVDLNTELKMRSRQALLGTKTLIPNDE